MGKWTNEYSHERAWKQTDTTRVASPLPSPDESLRALMRTYLEGRDLSYDCAVRLGGWYPSVFYGPRIIIPCVRTDGGGTWWQARAMTDLQLKRWTGSSGYKGDAVCYIPGGALGVIVCEGPMDALAAASLGYRSIAILGAAPPSVVFDHVVRLAGQTATVLPDMDRVAAWQNVQQKLGQRGLIGRLSPIPGGHKDLAAMPLELRKEFLRWC